MDPRMRAMCEASGRCLRSLREGSGLTQDQVAVAVGITQASLSNYERGRRAPSLPVAMALADVLGVSLADLAKAAQRQRRPSAKPQPTRVSLPA